MDLVSEAAERSMRAAIDEVESLPHYQDEGEVMKCVHIHHSTANAYHTTVPCLSGNLRSLIDNIPSHYQVCVNMYI